MKLRARGQTGRVEHARHLRANTSLCDAFIIGQLCANCVCGAYDDNRLICGLMRAEETTCRSTIYIYIKYTIPVNYMRFAYDAFAKLRPKHINYIDQNM